MYLPLTNNPEEKFSVSINDTLYNFRQLWSEYGFWALDISLADGTILISGVKLVVQEDILGQYPNIPFGLLSSDDTDPERDNLEEFEFEVIDIVS